MYPEARFAAASQCNANDVAEPGGVWNVMRLGGLSLPSLAGVRKIIEGGTEERARQREPEP